MPTNTTTRIQPIVDLGSIWERIGIARPIEFRVSFARPDDLLVCDFIFDNLKLQGKKLVRKERARAATLIVELPPQSFAEQAFLDATGPVKKEDKFPETSPETSKTDPSLPKPKNVFANAESLNPLPFAKIRMAGRSRMAFAMPADEAELAFTLDAILDACRRWPMRLDINATPEPRPQRVFDNALSDKEIFDKDWLRTVTGSADWTRAAQILSDILGEGERMERGLSAAGKRIADRAVDALNSGETRDLNVSLTQAMNREIDSLARDFPGLHEEEQRKFALAALSLASAQAFASGDVHNFDIGDIEFLPFIPVFLAPHKPAPTVTALELPYRVILSPIPHANWRHTLQPVVHNGRAELWHTRLTNMPDGMGADSPAKVRAIWSPDYEIDETEIIRIVNDLEPFRTSLDALDRRMLVKLMAGFNERDNKKRVYIPRPARSQRLALSALGALLDVEGNWNNWPEGVALEQWRHLATLGRDHYVRVVYRGFLKEFGHCASLIKVTERKFEYLDKPGKKNRVAVLRQQFFIVVRERVKEYTGAGHVHAGRNFPFTSVEILTSVTPSLLAPDQDECMLSDPSGKIYSEISPRACFWPMIDQESDFNFQIAATDLSGNRVTFAMPLLFVGLEANESFSVIGEIIKQNNDEIEKRRRTASLGNATVCYAPLKLGSEGDPRLPTVEMTFGCTPVTDIAISNPNNPRFYPEVRSARVGVSAIQRLLQQPNAVTDVEYTEVYKEAGFTTGPGSANSGEVFLKTLQPFDLGFGDKVRSDALGALATPSMAIQGLSRIMGPVAAKPPTGMESIEKNLGKVINNTFDPTDFFKGATILGGVELSSILDQAASLAGSDVPKLLTKHLPDKIEARFDWETKINKSDPAGLFVPKANGKDTTLKMRGVVSSPIAQSSAAVFVAEASISNFKVNLFGFIIIWFDKLSFTSKSGSKPDIAVDLHPCRGGVEFGGPLEFVNTLREIIPSNGFSDPPSLAVTPSGISASYSLNVPSVAVGIFALEHVSLGAGFTLPFDAKPVEVHFNFCERQRPFSLTVSLLGGGGFFALGVGAEGVREIEAALEFGAALSINLGVASGSVEVKAGVYFHWMQKSVELTGYVRLHGELSVLGIISLSLTFNLQLTYLKENGRSVVWGEVTLEVEVEVLFFSASVPVKCRREFGGSDSDPKFIELIPDQAAWTDYCEAFAAEAA